MTNARGYDLLPEPERREWLLDRLGDLAERAGVEPLVSWPLIEPDDWFFPDHWNVDDDRTILRLLRRLLWYVGLEELDVVLHVVDEPEYRERPAFVVEPHRSEAVAWYAGIEGQHCHFGVFRARLTSGSDFAAAMAHEVAHVYRDVNHLEVIHRDTEEQLTDLTTIFLGTGILSTNAAYQYRSSVSADSAFGSQWQHKRLGYLSHDSLAFLLAARCSLRDPDRAEIDRLAALLEPTQRECFLQAMAYFDDQDDSLAHRLRLPPRDTWAPIESAELLVEWDGSDDVAVRGAPNRAELVRPVHDVTPARERDYALHAGGASVVASLVAASLDPGDWRAALFAVPIVGFFVGRLRRYYLCGTAACGGRVQIGQRCASCGSLAVSEDHPWS